MGLLDGKINDAPTGTCGRNHHRTIATAATTEASTKMKAMTVHDKNAPAGDTATLHSLAPPPCSLRLSAKNTLRPFYEYRLVEESVILEGGALLRK